MQTPTQMARQRKTPSVGGKDKTQLGNMIVAMTGSGGWFGRLVVVAVGQHMWQSRSRDVLSIADEPLLH